MKTGKIGTELSSMLASSPNYIQAKAQYEKEKQVEDINSSIRNIYNPTNNVVVEEEDPFVKITNDLIKEYGYDQNETALSAFQQYVENDPAIKQYTTALSGTNQQIYDTQTLLNDAVKDFSNQKGDMPISSFVIASESRFRTLNDSLSNLKALKEVQQADLTMATNMANAKYQAVSQDIQQANTQKNAVIGQLIQAQFSMATKKAEADMAKEVAKEAMNDPYVAIPQMIAQYTEL
jgi:seryl-tRNA synthetase